MSDATELRLIYVSLYTYASSSGKSKCFTNELTFLGGDLIAIRIPSVFKLRLPQCSLRCRTLVIGRRNGSEWFTNMSFSAFVGVAADDRLGDCAWVKVEVWVCCSFSRFGETKTQRCDACSLFRCGDPSSQAGRGGLKCSRGERFSYYLQPLILVLIMCWRSIPGSCHTSPT